MYSVNTFRLGFICFFSLFILTLVAERTVGSGFSYQGRYEKAGLPVDGTVDLYFSLWDAPMGGNRIGEVQPRPGIEIVDGVFNTILNSAEEFGPEAFAGEPRWLEIWVCDTPGCASPETLAPRQPIKATPYALHSAGPWQSSGTQTVSFPGYVGIGTDSPNQPLEIANGRLRFSSPFGDIEFVEVADLIAFATTPGPEGTLPALRVITGEELKVPFVVLNNGNVGVGTATPGKSLTVAGNMEIGLDHGYYQHLRLGGGNSSGFLYGSFPRFADGIHLGYNYYADNAGVDQVIRPDGATSRITAGYGYLSLATGGVGQPPIDRVVVDSIGNVRLGPSTQYYAPAGDENLRILRGTIHGDGAILQGAGFTVTRTTRGRYSIVFNNPFPSPPSITATPRFLGSGSIGQRLAYLSAIAPTDAVILIVNLDGEGVDGDFDFIAVGPR